MRCLKARALLTALAMTTIATPALAAPWGLADPRVLGMGGTSVASGDSANAALTNPALLAAPSARDNFALSLPIGARVADPDELLDAVDDFSDAEPIDAFRNALNAFNADTSEDELANAAIDAGNELIRQLRNLDNKRLQAEANAALVIGSPGERLGFSVYADGYLTGGTISQVTEEDIGAIQDVINALDGIDPVNDPTTGLTSSVEARFATVVETGVALATRLESLGGIAIGVTPKYMQVRTYDYSFSGDELDDADIELEDGERKDSDFNLDIGIAKEWDNGWIAGFAVHNVLEQKYRTARDNTVKIEPQARVGVAHRGEKLTVALDLDLTEIDTIGFGGGTTQNVMIGAELDLWRALRLRLGYRHNLGDVPPGEEEGVASAGIGLRLFGATIDAAVAGNSDEITAAARLGLTF